MYILCLINPGKHPKNSSPDTFTRSHSSLDMHLHKAHNILVTKDIILNICQYPILSFLVFCNELLQPTNHCIWIYIMNTCSDPCLRCYASSKFGFLVVDMGKWFMQSWWHNPSPFLVSLSIFLVQIVGHTKHSQSHINTSLRFLSVVY